MDKYLVIFYTEQYEEILRADFTGTPKDLERFMNGTIEGLEGLVGCISYKLKD